MSKLTLSRRNFLNSTAILSGTALGSAALPMSASALTASSRIKPVYKAPLFDPTLENYPGYSARIPAPNVQLAEAGHNLLDTQLLV